MNSYDLDQRIKDLLSGIKSDASDKVYETSKRIIECPQMLTCLDLFDINITIRNCDAVEAIAIDCLGEEISDKVKSTLHQIANMGGFIPQNLLVFIEQHKGYSITMRDIASFQDAIKELPAEINVIWGAGNNPSGEGQVGLYFIMGYKKVEGVSQNESGID